MTRTWFDWLATGVGIALLIGSLLFLAQMVQDITLTRILSAIHQVALWQIAAAIGLTLVSFGMIIGFEYTAARYTQLGLPFRNVAYAGTVGEAFNNVLNLSFLGASAARLRIYTQWNVTPQQFTEHIAFVGLSSWFGFTVLGGAVLLLAPSAALAQLKILSPLLFRLIAAVFLLTVVIYFFACVRIPSVRLFRWRIPIPSWQLATRQIGYGVGDWIAQALLLYVLFPSVQTVPLVPYLVAFTVAMFVAIVGHVPAGLGVFDSGTILLLAPFAPKEHVIAALILFRLMYHVIPFILAAVAFGEGEIRRWITAATE